jgi:hypothetical protein
MQLGMCGFVSGHAFRHAEPAAKADLRRAFNGIAEAMT